MSGPLKKYRVTRGGVETVMKLSDADAARLGVGADDVVGAASAIRPVELAAGADGDGEVDDGAAGDGVGDGVPDSGDGAGARPAAKKTAAKRRATAANKARTQSATKAADGG